jgi:hypothetical protein
MFKTLSVRLSILLIILMIIVTAVFTQHLVRDRTRQFKQMITDKGVASAKTGSMIVSQLFDRIIDDGIFTVNEIFDHTLIPVELPDTILERYGSVSKEDLDAIRKYHYTTTLDSYLDNVLVEIEDSIMEDPQIVYAVLIDSNSYIPTHNSLYNKRLTGDYTVGLLNNRTKRIFSDEGSLMAARNVDKPYVKHVFRRENGELFWEISCPVFVKGSHWGCFCVGISLEKNRASHCCAAEKIDHCNEYPPSHHRTGHKQDHKLHDETVESFAQRC